MESAAAAAAAAHVMTRFVSLNERKYVGPVRSGDLDSARSIQKLKQLFVDLKSVSDPSKTEEIELEGAYHIIQKFFISQ